MLNMIAKQKSAQDERSAAAEFARLARLVAESKGSWATVKMLAQSGRITDRVKGIVAKADIGMISAPGGSPETWGSSLAYDQLAGAFLASLVNSNSFDAALPWMKRVPLKTRVMTSSIAAVAAVVDEATAKAPVNLDLSDQSLDTVKVATIIVTSNDLLRLGGSVAAALFNSELITGIARATDQKFVSTLIAASSPTASSGGFLFDVSELLAAVDGDANSKYFLVVEPSTLKTVAMQAGANGREFPELTVYGGELGGVRVVASDGLSSGQVLAFDAQAIAADPGTVGLDASRNATLDMAGSFTPTFDLFSKDATALRAERLFGFKLLRATAAASISGADYS